MTRHAEIRRLLFRFGIATALVVTATGVALLIPSLPLLIIYMPVAAVAAWKADWAGSVAATLLSTLSAGYLSGLVIPELIAFTAAMAAASAIVRAFGGKTVQMMVAARGLWPLPFAIPQPPVMRPPEERLVAEHENARRQLDEQLAAERETLRLRIDAELAAEREALERQAAERLAERVAAERDALERQTAERLAEQVAVERRAIERQAEEDLTAQVAAQIQTIELQTLRFTQELAAERFAMEPEAAQQLAKERNALTTERTRPSFSVPRPLPSSNRSIKNDPSERRRTARPGSGTRPKARQHSEVHTPNQAERYEVSCFTCGDLFDAVGADWCSCLGTEHSFVCTHCSTCFCKATDVYKGRFWKNALPVLFQRRLTVSKRPIIKDENPIPDLLNRPLVLLVEDDQNIRLIVRRVALSLGYGFLAAEDGQEGLAMARRYNPELIVSDAFMPRMDGREMCRVLKEDPATAHIRVILMTGVYTSRKYHKEAMDRFKVDQYLAKPLSIDDLIELFHKQFPDEA